MSWVVCLFRRRTLAQLAAADLRDAQLSLYRATAQQEDAAHSVAYYTARVARLQSSLQTPSLPLPELTI